MLLGSIDPVVLAGLLYAGSGTGLALLYLLRRTDTIHREARLSWNDLPWLVGSVIAGGIVGPVLLMVSLQHTPAATASLLLTFECVSTSAIAAVVFREAIGRRIWLAIGLITLASTILAINLQGSFGVSPGALGIIGACIMWGIDNNLTCYISSKDPVAISMIKGLGAGTFSLAIALLLGRSLPGPAMIAIAMGIGVFSYGLSIAMFVLASRGMGAARTSAWFGIAPFAGAILSLLLFRDFPGVQFLLAVPFMVAGTLLLFGEEHNHLHIHAPIEHEHYYTPDQHHPFKNSGACRHRHKAVRHAHPHRPDIHHRHGHEEAGERESDNTR